jgi:1-phosphofructokinase
LASSATRKVDSSSNVPFAGTNDRVGNKFRRRQIQGGSRRRSSGYQSAMATDAGGTVCVFAPSPLLTVTVEAGERGAEIHLHAGGQGVWQARMITELGVAATLCGPFGGETGRVLTHLIGDEEFDLKAVRVESSNGAYVHDRRSGDRVEVAEMAPPQLSRHDVDELYGIALIEGLESDVCVLGGPHYEHVVPAAIYRRLAHDLRSNGKTVIVDLSGEPLKASLQGGVTVLKVADDEVDAEDDDPAEIARELQQKGADHVIVTRGREPALALYDGELYEVVPPELESTEHRGAGDSLTAGIAAGLARGLEFMDALRLGAAAGATNVTRRGLASGNRDVIERLAKRVELRPAQKESQGV